MKKGSVSATVASSTHNSTLVLTNTVPEKNRPIFIGRDILKLAQRLSGFLDAHTQDGFTTPVARVIANDPFAAKGSRVHISVMGSSNYC